MADGDRLILGSEGNTANNRTALTKNQGFFPALDLFNDDGVGLLIIAGESVFHPGGPVVKGEALAAFSPGTAVVGNGGESGVFGNGKQTGVEGVCDAGSGVRGQSKTGIGVLAQSGSGPGVHAESSDGFGVTARSNKRPAVLGRSARGVGIVGTSGVSAGVLGVGGKTGAGVVGLSFNANSGEFYGPVAVLGDFTVIGGSKSAAVPFPDGSYRQLFTMESPDAWFEDFGRAELRSGKATVKLAPDFAAVIDSRQKHIFLTPEGDCNGLYVSKSSAKAFDVRELQKGKSSVRFSYRIVARRKDVRPQRMRKVKVPQRPPIPEAEPTGVKFEPRETRKVGFYRQGVKSTR